MRKECKHCLQFANYGDFLIRLVVGVIFILAGFGKLFGSPGITNFSGMLGWLGPFAVFFAVVVGIVELVGGIMILLGYKTSIPAGLLAFIMLVAIITVHNGGWNDMKYPLLLMFACVRYVGTPGYLSLQAYMKKK